MCKRSLFSFTLAALVLTCAFSSRVFSQNYKLVWSDEFDGTSVDPNKWVFEKGNNNGWGNNELEYYRPENATVANGILTITAQKESYGGYNYTSARMKTQGKYSVKYGKIEARIKLPYGKGIWPAFWMLGDNISTVGWPKCGELDIMEMTGGGTIGDKTVYGTLHYDDNGHKQVPNPSAKRQLTSGNFSDDFHTFAITWDDSQIFFLCDDMAYGVVSYNTTTMSEFQNSYFILLNLAVGGNWPGNPDGTTVFPQTMQVDYVRVYQLDNTSDIKRDGDNKTEKEMSQPTGFMLEQNFPNPFNPSTVISYRTASEGHNSLKVFNVMGKEVASLVNSEKPAGNYDIKFDASAIPSGVYYYSLSVRSKDGRNDYSSIKKMMVVK